MRKIYLSVLTLICAITIGYAQVGSTYNFTANSGTYTDITGGTPVATSVSAADFLGDTKTSVAIPLGFNFVFDGITYTQAIAASDGFLSFNTAATTSLTNNLSTSIAARRPLVAPLWDDLDGASGSGAANYITTGTVGSQVFTIEWKNWQWNYAATGVTISFQVKLYEGSNRVEFIYRQESGTVNSGTASIGIASVGTGSGNFLSLNNASSTPTVSSATETTSISTKPATGQVYAFAPNPIAAIDLAATAIATPPNCPNGSYPVAVTIRNAGTNTLNFSSGNATVTLNITGAATQTLTATVSSGTLAPTGTQVVMVPGANLLANGTYSLAASVAISGDTTTSNNTTTATATIISATTPYAEPFTAASVPTGWVNNGWLVGSTRGVTGNPGNNIYKNLYSSAATGDFTTLSTGPVAASDSLKFDYKLANYSSPYAAPTDGWGSYKVQVSTDCGASFITLDSVTLTTGSWITRAYPLSAYAGQRIKVRIVATWLAGDYDLAFDNFKIETALPCATPTAVSVSTITANSASVSFSAAGNSYIVEYGATGFTPGTGATAGTGGRIVTGTSSPITITGLTPTTSYQVSVRQNCTGTGNGYSYNAAAVSFTTTVACPIPTAVSVGSITTTTASVAFTSTGSSFIVEYGATGFTPGTGATAGTGGTVITGNSSPVSIIGLSANTTYQVYVRQNCSAAGNGYSTNTTAVSFTTLAIAPTACATNISPASGATGVTPPINFSWSAVSGATSYTLYIGTTNPPVDSITTVTTTTATITGGAPNTTYFWYVVPKNSGGAATGCSANTTRYTTTTAPANDACANATGLTVSNGFCSAPVLGTLAFADSTTGLGAATCATTALKYDVWYRVAIPATGNVTVQTSAVNTTVTDLVLQAYSGSCGSLSAIGCDDDGNPAPSSPSAAHAKLGLTGRTPGEVVYFRVMPYSSASIGAFSICAFDTTASVLPVIATGTRGTCTPAIAVVADSAWKYSWVPLKDASGNIIAELYPNGNILGNTSASFYINNGAVRQDAASIFYLDRNITITPATQPTSSVTTRLYFTNAELTTFVTAAGTTTRSQLNVSKTNQTCAASAVAAGAVLLAQSASAAYGADHYVEVANPSFSTFYLHKGSTPLPIKFEYLTGKKAGTTNALNWKVTCTSTSITLVLERSADARTFSHNVTSITATQARCGQPFDAVDAAPINGISYYRLKMIDVDGKVSYSPIAAVLNGKAGAELVGIYPTVVKDQAYLSVTSSRNTTMQFSISDMSGKVIKTINQAVSSGSSMLPVNTSNLATGVYNITGLLDGTRTQTLRFVKQ